ncbi:tetratricopeptide repeat protein [Vibrio splendidus]|uniref:Tetratricopeptide repeat protein n=1 Tax=Vibrio splendidus TaxID=29497 RepID=A0ABD5A6M6_VIBSP|nr:tetratricopeptide repeat protein [Vibrio splendidus]MBT9242067.1 sel1 repeat family protein [Vibrio splendidus]MDP2488744.1 tetratricopeptide repeat protein [Vibrio splendidus]MDP2616500.1 tetratricopeptide repeat protein [Vibrio splendidus]PTQ21529.1 sel1 repeat family protein [Vibrio splendidus]
MMKQSCTFLTSLSLLLSANTFAYDLEIEAFEGKELALLKTAENSSDNELLMQAANLLIEDSMYEENLERGYEYMNQLAESGEVKAIITLADKYYYDEQYEKALAWYHKAESSKDAYALYLLGVMYFDGEGTPVDLKKGNDYYLASAQAGYSDAMYQLAFSYDEGQGVTQDFTKSAYWFEQSANLGDASAMYNLGISYLNGQGVEKSCSKAMQLFSNAIEEDEHTLSYVKMGDIYSSTRYKKPCGFKTTDAKKALEYYISAAMQGNDYGQYSVGYAYRNGHGTWSDFVKALAWFEVAQEYGNSDAEKEIIDVKQYMTKENIAAAEQLKDSLIEDIW